MKSPPHLRHVSAMHLGPTSRRMHLGCSSAQIGSSGWLLLAPTTAFYVLLVATLFSVFTSVNSIDTRVKVTS